MAEPIVISLCTLTGLVRMEWSLSFKRQVVPFGRGVIMSVVQGVSPISAARNLALYEAKKKNAKYALFYDDDIMPQKPDAISQLVATMDNMPEATLVGSVCPIRREVPEPVVVKEYGDGPWYGWRDGRVHQVYHSGTAFLLIRIADLEDIVVSEEEVEGEIVRKFFGDYSEKLEEPVSDDYYLAEVMAANNKLWLVNGSVMCDQIDSDGKFYSVIEKKMFAPV